MRRRNSKSSDTAREKHLPRLGMAAPIPFCGREGELDELAKAVDRSPLTVVTGAAGVGKTALARELATRLRGTDERRCAYVRCEDEDDAGSVLARAERALDVVPGTLPQVLAASPRVLILDELHRLSPGDAAQVVDGLVAGPQVAGRVVALSRDVLPLRRGDATRADVKLEGLGDAAGRALWGRLEEMFGPAPATAGDTALERTRGVPLALRREYARATVDKKAWDPAALGADERRLLCAASVLRLPATPAALGALCPGVAVEKGVRELMRRQLVDATATGHVEVHDVVRAAGLAALGGGERKALELAAATLLRSRKDNDEEGGAPSWEEVDGAALDVSDPIDRLREAVRHLAAAGKLDDAARRLIGGEALLARRGGGGEALALVALLERAGYDAAALRALRVRVLARAGRVAEVLAGCDGLDKEGDDLALVAARAALHAGDLAGASARLRTLVDHIQPGVRARALALAADVAVEEGAFDTARARAQARGKLDPAAKALLTVAGAAAELREGRTQVARQALARLANASALGAGVGLEAVTATALAACLIEDGRFADAEATLASAERAAREHDEPALAAGIRARRAQVAAATGRLRDAEATLRELAAAARARGDELSALHAERDLTEVLLARGRAAEAAKVAHAVDAAASSRKLATLVAEARALRAAAELDELRVTEAQASARAVLAAAAPQRARRRAERVLELCAAWLGEPAPRRQGDDEAGDEPAQAELELDAQVALARGDAVGALGKLTELATHADRAGRKALVARAFAEAARLHRARGDRAAAECAAARALGDGAAGGADRAVARALLVRAALSRDEGDLSAARTSATDALAVARASGLGIERLAAAAAAEVVTREGGDAATADTLGAIRRAATATLSEHARAAGERILSDLGLSLACPYRLIDAAGAAGYVADVDGAALRLDKRSLVVDGAAERIVRSGKTVADLRRRSLLKRLLFLFAGEPGKLFSKEEIVKRVWDVEYHPLRHDAALFTNVMRLRRLLGQGGAEILRVGEGGYRLEPPKDFLFVDKLAH